MESFFKGQEYLGLYPFIEHKLISESDKYQFWVIDQNNNTKYTTLSDWLEGSKLVEH